jgi:hypothetical protein
MATYLGAPVDPLVGITTAISAGTVLNLDEPNARAGPRPSRADSSASAICVIDHSCGT